MTLHAPLPPEPTPSPRSLMEAGMAIEQETVQAALQRIRHALSAAHEAVHAAVALTSRQRLPGARAPVPTAPPEPPPVPPDLPHGLAGNDADAIAQAVQAAAQAAEQAQLAAQAQAEAAVAAAGVSYGPAGQV